MSREPPDLNKMALSSWVLQNGDSSYFIEIFFQWLFLIHFGRLQGGSSQISTKWHYWPCCYKLTHWVTSCIIDCMVLISELCNLLLSAQKFERNPSILQILGSHASGLLTESTSIGANGSWQVLGDEVRISMNQYDIVSFISIWIQWYRTGDHLHESSSQRNTMLQRWSSLNKVIT